MWGWGRGANQRDAVDAQSAYVTAESAEHFSIPPLCQEGPYCFQRELECHFLRNDCVDLRAFLCLSCASWHAPRPMVCMPYAPGGRLQGHGDTRSLGVHGGERKQA